MFNLLRQLQWSQINKRPKLVLEHNPKAGFPAKLEEPLRIKYLCLSNQRAQISRVSNCVTRFLKQFEAERIEAMEICNSLTMIENRSSSMLAVLATI